MPPERCIYCFGPSEAATSREHVIPEALGNPDWVLDACAVCDRCNNWLGSRVEKPFLNGGIGAVRMLIGIPGKKGNPRWCLPRTAEVSISIGGGPALERSGGKLRTSISGTLTGSELEQRPVKAEGKIKFRDDVKPHQISAFLSKILISSVAAQLGVDVALRSDLDLHRSNVSSSTQDQYIPYAFKRLPDSKLQPAWAVILTFDGLTLELWNTWRYHIRLDGTAPGGPSASSSVRLPIDSGALAQFGGPLFWPPDLLGDRRAGI